MRIETIMEISCPVLDKMYGGMPEVGGFHCTTEFEIGAQRIAEAAHCILGSLGKTGRPGQLDWQRMRTYEAQHVREELGIIERGLKEYGRPLYSDRLNDDFYKRNNKEYIVKDCIASIRKASPSLKAIAEKNLKELQAHPIDDQVVHDTAVAAYEVLITLAEAMFESVRAWPQGKITNPYKKSSLKAVVRSLKAKVDKLFS